MRMALLEVGCSTLAAALHLPPETKIIQTTMDHTFFDKVLFKITNPQFPEVMEGMAIPRVQAWLRTIYHEQVVFDRWSGIEVAKPGNESPRVA